MVKAPPTPPSALQVEERELPKPVLATPEAVFAEGNEKSLIYGGSGVGKTFTALTAPDPIWFLGIGGPNELKTHFGKDFMRKHGRREVHTTWVKEDREEHGQMSDNPNGFDLVCDAIDGFIEWDQASGVGVQTIVVDNATYLEHYIMNKAIAAEYSMSSKVDKAVLTREREYGIRKPHDSTYGGAQSLMDNIVRWLFELPYNIVFVAHEYLTTEQIEGTRERRLVSREPLFVGKQRTTIPNLFDNVWWCYASGGGRSRQFRVQTIADEKTVAKTRVGGVLSDPETDLNLTDAFNELQQYARSLEPQE